MFSDESFFFPWEEKVMLISATTLNLTNSASFQATEA
jgi:hypothetical protein